MTDIYGMRVWNAAGQQTLDVTDSVTKILWQGVIPFPWDAPTSWRYPNSSQPGDTIWNASSSVTVESEGFLDGTPFVMFHDRNGKYRSSESQMCTIRQNLGWHMLSPTTMKLTYILFSPGWSQQSVLNGYNRLDVPVLIGVF